MGTRKPRVCDYFGCGRAHYGGGFCQGHAQQLRRAGGRLEALRDLPKADPCAHCGEPAYYLGLCQRHYKRRLKHGDASAGPELNLTDGFCSVPHCNSPSDALGLCVIHYRRQWYREQYPQNPARFLKGTHTRRAREREAATFDIIPKDRRRLDSMPCQFCGSTEAITDDHIVPIARGGSHGIGNLTRLCRSCNSRKKDRTIMEYRKRFAS
jgi:5-methylcytosine-specific restriction endonuclease McrA